MKGASGRLCEVCIVSAGAQPSQEEEKEALEVLAFYLPQFHPIPENDEWWGKGFTEWRSVAQATPRFAGHVQPHVPADLGFVDLRCPEVMAEQARLAGAFGITGFVMYHYWFSGHQLLERPVNSILADPAWPGRFALCWANETWSRVWDGLEHDILIRQEYGEDDDARHAQELARMMQDSRYIRLDGRPLFLIYRPGSHPNLERFCDMLTQAVAGATMAKPLILGVRSSFDTSARPSWADTVHGVVGFQPNRAQFVHANPWAWLMDRARRWMPRRLYEWLKRRTSTVKRVHYRGTVDQITTSWREAITFEYPVVFPNWDNTPRRETPIVIQCDDPVDFGHFAGEAVRYLETSGVPGGPLFVNAWNEWAEGCHLEPDIHHGRAFLEQLAQVVRRGPVAQAVGGLPVVR